MEQALQPLARVRASKAQPAHPPIADRTPRRPWLERLARWYAPLEVLVQLK